MLHVCPNHWMFESGVQNMCVHAHRSLGANRAVGYNAHVKVRNKHRPPGILKNMSGVEKPKKNDLVFASCYLLPVLPRFVKLKLKPTN